MRNYKQPFHSKKKKKIINKIKEFNKNKKKITANN